MLESAASRSDSNSASSSASAQIKQIQFDSAIALSLGLWEALSTAVANSWGGPDSESKRDWFAGAVSDLFLSHPDTDEQDLECVLLQVMEDEFDVRIEDETEVEIAARICRIRRSCEVGDFSEVLQLQQRWISTQGRRQTPVIVQETSQDVDSDDEPEEGVGGVSLASDVEMSSMDTSSLTNVEDKSVPKVDADGFTRVVGRKKR